MTAADERLLDEIAANGTELAAAEAGAKKLRARRLVLFGRARKRGLTTTRIAEAADIEVGAVRQILKRMKDGD